MRVRDAVAEALDIHGLTRSKAERERKIVEALTLVGLAPPDLYLDRFPHELSGGQRQRVGIAAAMVLNPSLLVADEPVSMLDVSARAGVLRVFTELSQRGVGIVTITHDLSTAAGFADRIYVMYLGRIIEHGRAKEVVRNPQHPYTKALMSVIPARDPHIGRRPQILSGEIPNPMNVPRGCRFHPRCPAAISRCRDIDPQLHDARAARSPDHQAACILA
jgi:oligopeptide/dipeptide ABC transporter ATP-binding protein